MFSYFNIFYISFNIFLIHINLIRFIFILSKRKIFKWFFKNKEKNINSFIEKISKLNNEKEDLISEKKINEKIELLNNNNKDL